MTNLTLYLRLIRAIRVLLVAKLWENIWKRGYSEVKFGNYVERWSSWGGRTFELSNGALADSMSLLYQSTIWIPSWTCEKLENS